MKPTALITGGSRGIGFAISKMLCEHGYDVAVNGVRDESRVQDALAELKSTGANVIYCQGDIGSKEDRRQIIENVKSSFGRLNVLVNNAGVAPIERLDPLIATEE